MRALDRIDMGGGRDGITVLAAASVQLLDPARNTDITARDGARSTVTNSGRRSVPLTSLALILDALGDMDEALETHPERHALWLAGRSALVDAWFATSCGSGTCRFQNPGVLAILEESLPFVRDRLDAHRGAGDIGPWANGLGADFEDVVDQALVAGMVRTLDSGVANEESLTAISSFLDYLLASRSLPGVLVTAGESLQILEDEQTLLPLLRSLSQAVVLNAPEVVASGVALSPEPSVLSTSTDVAREALSLDDRNALAQLIGGLTRVNAGAGEEAALDVIVDVMVRLNRVEPDSDAALNEEDYRSIMDAVRTFLEDDSRGLERLYDVIQHREVRP